MWRSSIHRKASGKIGAARCASFLKLYRCFFSRRLEVGEDSNTKIMSGLDPSRSGQTSSFPLDLYFALCFGRQGRYTLPKQWLVVAGARQKAKERGWFHLELIETHGSNEWSRCRRPWRALGPPKALFSSRIETLCAINWRETPPRSSTPKFVLEEEHKESHRSC